MFSKNIIFTHGFIKKTGKTPNSEIEKAIKIKEYYRSKK
jgi:phage-related protein